MNDANKILSMVIVTHSRYCDSGLHNGKYFIEMKGYVTPEQMQYLNDLPPIVREPEIQIKIEEKKEE